MDRDHKGSLYAQARLADYWIVNLRDRVVEVHREPGPDAAASFGWRYRSVEIFGLDAMLFRPALPDVPVRVSDLLPESRPAP